MTHKNITDKMEGPIKEVLARLIALAELHPNARINLDAYDAGYYSEHFIPRVYLEIPDDKR